ncbi:MULTISPECIES: iron transporter [Salinibaculum]|uniref:iron transporter n=1 Tax=Salinibaculum TaxID=2732368 RepID=UPI0030CC8701
MRRRQFLAAGVAGLSAATAGCSGFFETATTRTPPLVENRPEAVYVPTHVEGMEMAGMASSGRYRFALTYSFPHRFWLVTGDRVRQVAIEDEQTVHLMLTAWDSETGTVIPSSSASVTATKEGETVVSNKQLWPMLSQNMGVHFGDNVALDGDGTYEVQVTFGPVETRRAGALAGALADRAEPTFTLEFSQSELDEVSYERLPDRQGERAAVDPMPMEMVPSGQLPAAEALPGTLLATGRGVGETGDGMFAITTLDSPPEGVDGEGTYLAVSARTPYNRYPLPFMSLAATLSKDGETVSDGDLTETLHPDLGYHYGAVVDSVPSQTTADIAVDAPPQIARHEGYETAFVDMDGISLTV